MNSVQTGHQQCQALCRSLFLLLITMPEHIELLVKILKICDTLCESKIRPLLNGKKNAGRLKKAHRTKKVKLISEVPYD